MITYTTGQVANMLGAAPRTVSKWCDSGLLSGAYRLPGTGHDRRIPRSALIEFIRQHNIPLPDELAEGPRAVLFHGNASSIRCITAPADDVLVAPTLFTLGRLIDTRQWSAVVLDLTRSLEPALYEHVRAALPPAVPILVLHAEDAAPVLTGKHMLLSTPASNEAVGDALASLLQLPTLEVQETEYQKRMARTVAARKGAVTWNAKRKREMEQP